VPTLKYGSQYFAIGNPKYKSDKKKQHNSRCGMALYADENLKVSFEFIQWHRRNYGWSYIPLIWTIQRTYKICFVKDLWDNFYTTANNFATVLWNGVVVIVVVCWHRIASRAVDCGFEPLSGQTKNHSISICCFFAKNATLRRESKDGLARNQDNVLEWDDMSIGGLLFQWASTIQIQLSVLV